MKMLRVKNIVFVLMLAVALVVCCACGKSDDSGETDSDMTIIEPGTDDGDLVDNQTDPVEDEQTPDEDADAFVDYGRTATLEDLTLAQSQVQSYYFKQTIPYVDGSVTMEVWFKDNKMKVISSMDGFGITEMYYNYSDYSVLSYTPAEGKNAVMMTFDPSDPDLPNQPKADDYQSYSVLATEDLNGQVCRVLQTDAGDKLWISTLYGMPLQVEFTDSLGERYTVSYENLRINDITDDEVSPPADLIVYDVGSVGL